MCVSSHWHHIWMIQTAHNPYWKSVFGGRVAWLRVTELFVVCDSVGGYTHQLFVQKLSISTLPFVAL